MTLPRSQLDGLECFKKKDSAGFSINMEITLNVRC